MNWSVLSPTDRDDPISSIGGKREGGWMEGWMEGGKKEGKEGEKGRVVGGSGMHGAIIYFAHPPLGPCERWPLPEA